MGLFSRFRRESEEKALSASPAVLEALRNRQINPYPALGGTNVRVSAAYQRGIDATYGWMYSTQPAVRSVIDYIADNAAQLTLNLYKRTDEEEREKSNDHPAAKSMRYPNLHTSSKAFIRDLFTDYLIWNNAYFVKFGGQGPRVLERAIPSHVTVDGGRFTATAYWFWRDDGTWFGPIPPEAMFHWHGPNPADGLLGLSKLETLRQELASDAAVATAMVELAKGGLKGGHIERPADVPEWSAEDRNRFFELWKKAKADPQGTPILDEGMTYHQDSISPKDASVIDARKFTKEVVAQQFGMDEFPPKSEEARMQFYSDVLAPLIGQFCAQLDLDLVQGEFGATDYFFELDLNEKAYRDPWRLWSIFTSAAGAPFATRDEIRALVGWPALGGDADELIVPMNVTEESADSPSLPAPNVMPMQDPNKPPQDGSYRENGAKRMEVTSLPRRKTDMNRQRRYIDSIQALLLRHYTRQAQTLKSQKARAADTERWNEQLAADLEEEIKSIFEREGGIYVARLAGDDFDMRLVENWVKAMSESTAEAINAATQAQIEDVGTVDAIEHAKTVRAATAAATIGARVTHFARKEAAHQSPHPERRKQTWVANSERHASLDGATVALDSDWGGIEPGSEPNCACTAVIS